jgi:uncharacterized protein YjiK
MTSRISGWKPLTTRRGAPERAAARFTPKGTQHTGMSEASDVVALPGGRFLVVGDRTDKAVLVGADGSRTPLELPGLPDGHSQLEGVAYAPLRHHLFVSSDASATVAQIRLARDGDEVVGRLVQSFPLRDGKGRPLERVEGLAFNEEGDLFVLTENDGELHHLARNG